MDEINELIIESLRLLPHKCEYCGIDNYVHPADVWFFCHKCTMYNIIEVEPSDDSKSTHETSWGYA